MRRISIFAIAAAAMLMAVPATAVASADQIVGPKTMQLPLREWAGLRMSMRHGHLVAFSEALGFDRGQRIKLGACLLGLADHIETRDLPLLIGLSACQKTVGGQK